MADELVDLLDDTGALVGKQCLKSVAHKEGLYHPTVHVWCYTDADSKILLQKRGATKATFPSLWDVSVAGHIHAGEDPVKAAIREIKEEIGLKVSKYDLFQIGTFKSEHFHSDCCIDREFHHTFVCELTVPFSSLKKQKEEVEDLILIPLNEFLEDLISEQPQRTYVPHGMEYYSSILNAILKFL